MAIRRLWLALSLCAWAGAPAVANADGMRCGTKLVSDGDTQYDVRSRCGDPQAAARRVEYRTIRVWVPGPCVRDQGGMRCGYFIDRTIEVIVDEWTYDFGPHQFVRYLTFEQGRLVRVTTGHYGSSDG